MIGFDIEEGKVQQHKNASLKWTKARCKFFDYNPNQSSVSLLVFDLYAARYMNIMDLG